MYSKGKGDKETRMRGEGGGVGWAELGTCYIYINLQFLCCGETATQEQEKEGTGLEEGCWSGWNNMKSVLSTVIF